MTPHINCPACTLTATRPLCGAYQFQCLACCVRLVGTTRPSKTLAASMLAAIARFKGSPDRAEILRGLREKQGGA